jgi:putative DNA primase/helicase
MSLRFEPHDFAKHVESGGDYAEEDGILYEWNAVRWAPVDRKKFEKKAYEWLVSKRPEFASAANARAAVEAALLYSPALPKQTNAMLIPCQNGYVEVSGSGLRLIPAKREYGMRYAIDCCFDTEGPVPECFERFLSKVLPDPAVRARVQEYAGYTLTTDTRHQRAQMWIGNGANGKGVLANIIQKLHGNVQSANLGNLENFGSSGLPGASLIFSDEAPQGKINEHLLKSLIAGELVLVDLKYQTPLSTRIKGKWLVLGNQMPNIKDHSEGFWRRWDIVPFNVTIPEKERDTQLAEYIIENELGGVLNWALEGLLRLQARGKFDPSVPEEMSRMLTAAKAETNPLRVWVEDAQVENIAGSGFTDTTLVYDHYQSWCKRNGVAPQSAPRFWPELEKIIRVKKNRKRLEGRPQITVCDLRVAGLPVSAI